MTNLTNLTNQITRTALSSFFIVGSIALIGSALPAFAQDDDAMTAPKAPSQGTPQNAPPKGAPPKGAAGGGGFLSGPTVPPGAAQGDGSFGSGDGKRPGGGGGGDRLMFVMQEIRMFREAMQSVVPDLTPEQSATIEKLGGDFQAEAMAWRTANADAIKALEEKMKAARGSGKGARQGKGAPADAPNRDGAKDGGAKPDQPMPGAGGPGAPARGQPSREVMEEAQKLKSTMPKFEPVREKIMAVLTPEQQATLKESMGKMRKQGEGKRPDGKRPNGKGGDGSPAKAPPAADPAKGDYQFKD